MNDNSLGAMITTHPHIELPSALANLASSIPISADDTDLAAHVEFKLRKERIPDSLKTEIKKKVIENAQGM